MRAPTMPWLASALVAVATWDAWRWYVARVTQHPDEATALVLTVAALAGCARLRRNSVPAHHGVPAVQLALALLGYAAIRLWGPAIAAAAAGIAVTLYALHVAALRRRPPLAFWGLVALSLPVLPSLQFTLGFPLRVISAALTVPLLRLQGLAVAREGTFLVWRGEMVQFDAPCSGINMLWAGLMLTLLAGLVLRLGALRLLLALVLCVVATIAANVLRAASLFYIETGALGAVPGWWHEATGLAAFVLAAAAMLWTLSRIQASEVRA